MISDFAESSHCGFYQSPERVTDKIGVFLSNGNLPQNPKPSGNNNYRK
jgi:hypothetical protein